MPDPIQSSSATNQSYYDPSDEVSRAPQTGPSGATSAAAPPPPPTRTADGTALLLKQHGSVTQDCTKHIVSASAALVTATVSAAVGIATGPTGLGAIAGMVGTIGGISKGAVDMASYFDCEDNNERMRQAAADCSQSGGALVAGAGSSAICLIPRN